MCACVCAISRVQAEKLVLGFCEVDPADVGSSCLALFLMGLVYQTLVFWSVQLRLMYTKTHK